MSFQIFSRTTQAIIYGNQTVAAQRMLDFDFVCRRETPSVAAFVNPGDGGFQKLFFGAQEILVPVYGSIAEACSRHPKADVMINFASMRSAFAATVEALQQKGLRTIAIIAEGIPERRTRELIAMAAKSGKVLIGPATVGGIAAGAFRIGNTGGSMENLIQAKLYRPGSVGFVAKSGGMSNEMFNVIAQNSDGLYEGIAIGGDRFPGTRLIDHLLRFEANPAIKMHVVLGEVGGREEYAICEALEKGKIKKPLAAWVTGTCAKMFPSDVQFGHAGAMANAEEETAAAKNAALKKAGAIVPDSFDDFGEKINQVFMKISKKFSGKMITAKQSVIKNSLAQNSGKAKSGNESAEIQPAELPLDYEQERKAGRIRKATNFICSISDDRGEDCSYGHYSISEVVEKGMSIGEVISLLWFKKKLPKYATDFMEMIVKITADHGPCVSGAHNAMVTARAGKDVVSALCSGLLTIGPRFGGAIDGAAHYFTDAFDKGTKPAEFVNEMKAMNINIPGIGHRVKSTKNPDKRVSLLKKFAKKHFKKTPLLDYALEVEKLTTAKKANLILNVDGCIATCFVDMMRGCGEFSQEEVKEVIENGALNALFVFGRTIGIIGHVLDQKRYKQGLYRHPTDDVMFVK